MNTFTISVPIIPNIIHYILPLFAQLLENQMKIKEQQVKELDEQMVHMKKIEPEKENIIEARKAAVAER